MPDPDQNSPTKPTVALNHTKECFESVGRLHSPECYNKDVSKLSLIRFRDPEKLRKRQNSKEEEHAQNRPKVITQRAKQRFKKPLLEPWKRQFKGNKRNLGYKADKSTKKRTYSTVYHAFKQYVAFRIWKEQQGAYYDSSEYEEEETPNELEEDSFVLNEIEDHVQQTVAMKKVTQDFEQTLEEFKEKNGKKLACELLYNKGVNSDKKEFNVLVEKYAPELKNRAVVQQAIDNAKERGQIENEQFLKLNPAEQIKAINSKHRQES